MGLNGFSKRVALFNKLFKNKQVPTNIGDSSFNDLSRIKTIKHYVLELTNMEFNPTYPLVSQLTVGNEIGDIVIADPSISPRHATFILQQDVISVIDHGSLAGTFVNGTKLQPGKYIILEENDVIKVGDLELKIHTRVETIQQTLPLINVEPTRDYKIPAELKQTAPEVDNDEDIEELLEASHEEEEKPVKKLPPARPVKEKQAIAPSSKDSANALARVIALGCDFLLSYAILVVFLPFDDFRGFLEFIPAAVIGLLPVDWELLSKDLTRDYGPVMEHLKDIYTFVTVTFPLGQLFLMVLLTRLVSTFVFGVSVSELLLGIRATGNGVWARIGGVVRVLIGTLTGPLLIFDLPAVVSRRTFKEVVTFTNVQLRSRLVTIVATVLVVPLMLLAALLSPLLIGLEPPAPIAVNDKIEQKIRVETPPPAEEKIVTDSSRFFKLAASYDANELSIIPEFSFSGVKNRLNYKSSLVFYQRDLKRDVRFEVYKTFDLKKLLGFGMRGNVFLYEKFPAIYSFVYSASESNPSFRKLNDARSEAAFATEVIEFTKLAFELHAGNALEVMQSETPLLKGLVDYKASFLSLVEYKDFDRIGFIKIGNVTFMKFSYLKQKPFDLIIPLMKDQGRVFRVTFDKKENLSALTNKFYKYALDKADWIQPDAAPAAEVLSPFGVIDLFSSLNQGTQAITAEKAQALYAYYFEKTSEVLTRDDAIEGLIWKSSLGSILRVLEALRKGEADDTAPHLKLQQNFKDLFDAFENRNFEYFGITQSTTV